MVQYRRYYVSELIVSERVLPTRGGDLVVVKRENSDDLDWELVHRTTERVTVDQLPYHLQIRGPEATFAGDAVLVRSDGISHVFRGVGELVGFSADLFDAEV